MVSSTESKSEGGTFSKLGNWTQVLWRKLVTADKLSFIYVSKSSFGERDIHFPRYIHISKCALESSTTISKTIFILHIE